MDTMDKIIDRARKLLALADRNANEHEAALAASKAHALLMEHELTIESVGEDDMLSSAEIVEEAAVESQRLPSWRRLLLGHIARAMGCDVVMRWDYQTPNGRKHTELALVGTQADVTLAGETFNYLAEVVQRLTRRHCAGHGRRYSNAFRIGCAGRLGVRLCDHERALRAQLEEVTTVTGRELVVCKQEAIKRHMSQYSKGSAWSAQYGDTDGYEAGRAAGDKVSLSRQVGSNGPAGYLP